MKTWEEICGYHLLRSQIEANHCPHVPVEQADLYHCRDGGTTEFEFLNLIHSMIIATKPEVVLECGTYHGYGTLAIAHALDFNGYGRVITCDIDRCDAARELIASEMLDHRVIFETRPAIELCSDKLLTFDFAFVDSGDTRSLEAQALLDGPLKTGGILALHDASPYRSGPNSNANEVRFMSGKPQSLRIWKSRGFEFIQK
jgi:predicted O-methyltransferase YrrM